MRKTRGQLAVAAVLMTDPDGQHYGYALMQATGKRSGLIYQMLARMMADGLLMFHQEDSLTGPPRKYYTLTDKGRAELGALVNGASNDRTR
jgi:PadR family transcriptional regulator